MQIRNTKFCPFCGQEHAIHITIHRRKYTHIRVKFPIHETLWQHANPKCYQSVQGALDKNNIWYPITQLFIHPQTQTRCKKHEQIESWFYALHRYLYDSITYNQTESAIEANVKRVYNRIQGHIDDLKFAQIITTEIKRDWVYWAESLWKHETIWRTLMDLMPDAAQKVIASRLAPFCTENKRFNFRPYTIDELGTRRLDIITRKCLDKMNAEWSKDPRLMQPVAYLIVSHDPYRSPKERQRVAQSDSYYLESFITNIVRNILKTYETYQSEIQGETIHQTIETLRARWTP